METDLPHPLCAFGEDDRLHPGDAELQVFVDDDVLVAVVMAHLVGSLRHPVLHDLFGVLCPAAQARFEFPGAWRQNEYAYQIGAERPIVGDLLGALPIDIEQNVAAVGERFFDGSPGRAIEMAEDIGMFQKLARRNHLPEFVLADKKVVVAVGFRRAFGPGCRRDGERKRGIAFQQLTGDRRLARPGWRRQDKHQAASCDLNRCRGATQGSEPVP